MSNENLNDLIQIVEEQPELEAKAPYVKPKRVMSEKQLAALAKGGGATRVSNAKQISIEKEAKVKPKKRIVYKTKPKELAPEPEPELPQPIVRRLRRV